MSNRTRMDGLSLAVLTILMVGAWSIYDATSESDPTPETAPQSVEHQEALEAGNRGSTSDEEVEIGIRSEHTTSGSAGDVLGSAEDEPSVEAVERWKSEAAAIQRQLLEAMVSGDSDAIARARQAAAALASREGR